MTPAVRTRLTTAALVAAPLAALLLWLRALQGADPNQISDLGLITALPPAALAALALLIASFGLAVALPRLRLGVIGLHIAILVFCLFGAAMLVEGQPRTATAWKLVGIMDQVMDYGAVDPSRDAFQNWPGFFILVAFVTSVAGLESPLQMAGWAHVFFNLLYLGPLVLLFRAATQDRRLICLGLWFFYLCNWIGQDYLAPQAFGFFYYILAAGLMLTFFRGRAGLSKLRWLPFLPARTAAAVRHWFAPEYEMSLPEQKKQQAGVMAMLILFMAVITPSHQLTPVALLTATISLVLFGRIYPRGLPVVFGVLLLTWLSYMTVPYLSGHLDNFIEPLLDLRSNLTQNLSARVRGSAEHVFIVRFRIISSLLIWLFAFLGALRRQRLGFRDVSFVLLAGTPFSLLAVQTYGGELLLRTFLLSLPFIAFFLAALFCPRPSEGLARPTALSLATMSGLLCLTFFLTRYGNERMDYFAEGEVEAMQYVYSTSEPGAHIIAGTGTLPWRYEGYNVYAYSTIESAVKDNDIEALARQMASEEFPESYLVLTRSQKASVELFIGWEAGTWERFEQSVTEAPEFQLVFANADAKVFVLSPQTAAEDAAAQP
jgi:hypothetical protein